MSTLLGQGEAAGQIAWTRDLARDLFPGPATPFAWSVLHAPAEAALRRALTELGAPEPAAADLWQRAEDRYVRVSTSALAEAGRSLCGAAWLGPRRPEPPTGAWARLQMGGIIRRAQARIDQARAQAAALHDRLSAWLTWVRGLSWSQADLLQVMEELEPRARDALQMYFMLAAGLTAARAQVDDRLTEWLPDAPASVGLSLYAGLEDLLTVQAARQLAAAAAAGPDDLTRQAVLLRFGHRGPDEMRPDARRWADEPALLTRLAAQGDRHTADAAQRRRDEAETWIAGHLDGGRHRQFMMALARTRDLCRAVDLVWDALTMVMAAAQVWLRAASREALEAGLIDRPEEALYLELEELKQVATGEWHGGRSDEVQAALAQRRAAPPDKLPDAGGPAAPAGPGQAHGPAYIMDAALSPAPGAIWLAETADPGCAPFWLGAAAVVAAEADAWSPGMVAARALGVPAVGGGGDILARARSGQMISVDGAAACIVLD